MENSILHLRMRSNTFQKVTHIIIFRQICHIIQFWQLLKVSRILRNMEHCEFHMLIKHHFLYGKKPYAKIDLKPLWGLLKYLLDWYDTQVIYWLSMRDIQKQLIHNASNWGHQEFLIKFMVWYWTIGDCKYLK